MISFCFVLFAVSFFGFNFIFGALSCRCFLFSIFFLVYCVFIFFWKRIEFCAVFSYRRFQISNQHLVISWANFSLCILLPLRFNACIVCLNVFVHCIYICIDRWLVCLDVCGNFIFYRFIHKSYVQSQAEIQLRIGGGKKGTLWRCCCCYLCAILVYFLTTLNGEKKATESTTKIKFWSQLAWAKNVNFTRLINNKLHKLQ